MKTMKEKRLFGAINLALIPEICPQCEYHNLPREQPFIEVGKYEIHCGKCDLLLTTVDVK